MEELPNILPLVLSPITGFVVAFISIPTIVRVALTKHLYDEPGGIQVDHNWTSTFHFIENVFPESFVPRSSTWRPTAS